MRLADIQPWYIYRVKSNQTDPPKDKYAVIVYIGEDAKGFLINSDLTEWFKKRPYLHVCDPVIQASEHSSLKYDSYVDCQELFSFFDWEVTKKLGAVSKQARTDILNAIHGCPTLERVHKKLILSNEGYPGY